MLKNITFLTLNTVLSDGWRQSVNSTFFGIVDHEDDDNDGIHEEDQHQEVDALATSEVG
jgi:hypothetical protein